MSVSIALLFVSVSTTLHLPSGLLSAMCFVESNHRPQVVHKDDGPEDSVGICQMHPSTARWMGFKGTAKDLMRPEVNIYWAGKYLKYQLARYHGALVKSIAAYNAGRFVADNNGYAKNKKYVDKVLRAWKVSL